MFPAPETIATSRPSACTSTISCAISSMRSRSSPYSRSPMSASPESLRRPRRKATCEPEGVAYVSRGLTLISLREREPRELDDLEARLLECVAHRHGRVVDPDLLEQDLLGEEALLQHAVDDLPTNLLRFRLDVVGALEDPALFRDHLLGNLVRPDEPRRREGDVHRQAARL